MPPTKDQKLVEFEVKKERVEKEPAPAWAVVDLLLWSAFLLLVIGEVISLVGHSIFRLW